MPGDEPRFKQEFNGLNEFYLIFNSDKSNELLLMYLYNFNWLIWMFEIKEPS